MAGIIDTIKLASILVLALPAAFAGFNLFVGGERLVGATLLVLAGVLVIAQRRLSPSTSAKGFVVDRLTGAVSAEPTDDDEQ
ncbi:hypothetical protein D8Y22_07605 [Salinadaptatus halalkaliphilus]|uniref:Uncharacterized protein n=1 Tax=Salinadaptatus halalkaliphilus TaxID=2419781 RepID=A0A4S3TLP0_9EURY|nr:hypothetical protein [Salinadaptatus halalkaliphilus]THE65082.1 hypothetical protein D8Y22_07605 [Salinadaptatus halalkaliphilus]